MSVGRRDGRSDVEPLGVAAVVVVDVVVDVEVVGALVVVVVVVVVVAEVGVDGVVTDPEAVVEAVVVGAATVVVVDVVDVDAEVEVEDELWVADDAEVPVVAAQESRRVVIPRSSVPGATK